MICINEQYFSNQPHELIARDQIIWFYNYDSATLYDDTSNIPEFS